MKHWRSGMTKKEKENLRAIIENEGFEYTFVEYSRFDKVHDVEFHKLRSAFVRAYKELATYLEYDA